MSNQSATSQALADLRASFINRSKTDNEKHLLQQVVTSQSANTKLADKVSKLRKSIFSQVGNANLTLINELKDFLPIMYTALGDQIENRIYTSDLYLEICNQIATLAKQKSYTELYKPASPPSAEFISEVQNNYVNYVGIIEMITENANITGDEIVDTRRNKLIDSFKASGEIQAAEDLRSKNKDELALIALKRHIQLYYSFAEIHDKFVHHHDDYDMLPRKQQLMYETYSAVFLNEDGSLKQPSETISDNYNTNSESVDHVMLLYRIIMLGSTTNGISADNVESLFNGALMFIDILSKLMSQMNNQSVYMKIKDGNVPSTPIVGWNTSFKDAIFNITRIEHFKFGERLRLEGYYITLDRIIRTAVGLSSKILIPENVITMSGLSRSNAFAKLFADELEYELCRATLDKFAKDRNNRRQEDANWIGAVKAQYACHGFVWLCGNRTHMGIYIVGNMSVDSINNVKDFAINATEIQQQLLNTAANKNKDMNTQVQNERNALVDSGLPPSQLKYDAIRRKQRMQDDEKKYSNDNVDDLNEVEQSTQRRLINNQTNMTRIVPNQPEIAQRVNQSQQRPMHTTIPISRTQQAMINNRQEMSRLTTTNDNTDNINIDDTTHIGHMNARYEPVFTSKQFNIFDMDHLFGQPTINHNKSHKFTSKLPHMTNTNDIYSVHSANGLTGEEALNLALSLSANDFTQNLQTHNVPYIDKPQMDQVIPVQNVVVSPEVTITSMSDESEMDTHTVMEIYGKGYNDSLDNKGNETVHSGDSSNEDDIDIYKADNVIYDKLHKTSFEKGNAVLNKLYDAFSDYGMNTTHETQMSFLLKRFNNGEYTFYDLEKFSITLEHLIPNLEEPEIKISLLGDESFIKIICALNLLAIHNSLCMNILTAIFENVDNLVPTEVHSDATIRLEAYKSYYGNILEFMALVMCLLKRTDLSSETLFDQLCSATLDSKRNTWVLTHLTVKTNDIDFYHTKNKSINKYGILITACCLLQLYHCLDDEKCETCGHKPNGLLWWKIVESTAMKLVVSNNRIEAKLNLMFFMHMSNISYYPNRTLDKILSIRSEISILITITDLEPKWSLICNGVASTHEYLNILMIFMNSSMNNFETISALSDKSSVMNNINEGRKTATQWAKRVSHDIITKKLAIKTINGVMCLLCVNIIKVFCMLLCRKQLRSDEFVVFFCKVYTTVKPYYNLLKDELELLLPLNKSNMLLPMSFFQIGLDSSTYLPLNLNNGKLIEMANASTNTDTFKSYVSNMIVNKVAHISNMKSLLNDNAYYNIKYHVLYELSTIDEEHEDDNEIKIDEIITPDVNNTCLVISDQEVLSESFKQKNYIDICYLTDLSSHSTALIKHIKTKNKRCVLMFNTSFFKLMPQLKGANLAWYHTSYLYNQYVNSMKDHINCVFIKKMSNLTNTNGDALQNMLFYPFLFTNNFGHQIELNDIQYKNDNAVSIERLNDIILETLDKQEQSLNKLMHNSEIDSVKSGVSNDM